MLVTNDSKTLMESEHIARFFREYAIAILAVFAASCAVIWLIEAAQTKQYDIFAVAAVSLAITLVFSLNVFANTKFQVPHMGALRSLSVALLRIVTSLCIDFTVIPMCKAKKIYTLSQQDK